MKKTCVISCPIDTYSGYGARSRDMVKSLIKAKGDVWDIKILSQKWGSLPFGFLADHIEEDISSRIVKSVETNPEIWIQISIPNEFQRVGTKFNIGITAGIETDLCDKSWIEGINRMDEIWVSSSHSKKVFTNHPEIKPTKPIKVVFEGLNTEVYRTTEAMANMEINLDLNSIEEEFAFLYVGHWIGRKNVEGLVLGFYNLFKDKDSQPALILKTQKQSSSIADHTRIEKALQTLKDKFPNAKLPSVYVLHGELSDWEMNEVYNHKKVKAMVTTTRGEGFGRPLLEFSAIGKPIIASNWSGHLDFLNQKFTHLLFGKKVDVPASEANTWIVQGSQWFEVDQVSLTTKLSEVYENYEGQLPKANRQQQYVLRKFTIEKMDELVASLSDEVEVKTPTQVQVKLPKL